MGMFLTPQGGRTGSQLNNINCVERCGFSKTQWALVLYWIYLQMKGGQSDININIDIFMR